MDLGRESIDYVLPLAAHMARADGQLHDDELKQLQALAERRRVSEGTRLYVQAILDDEGTGPTFESALSAVPPQHRGDAFLALVAMALADRTLECTEKALLEQAARAWSVPRDFYDEALRQATSWAGEQVARQRTGSGAPSFHARLVAGLDTVFGPSLTDSIGRTLGLAEGVEEARREFVLAGPEYDDAIARCAAVAREDLGVCEAALQSAGAGLEALRSDLSDSLARVNASAERASASSAREAASLLAATEEGLDEEITQRLRRLRVGLRAKERTVDSFTIAFMGKTKAGKSTLHAVLSGQGHDAIGIGMQRTTRLNRVYHWKNIRVVDTPGIGAPGGASDEAIAETVVDEADLICYVVTNDSQQATEFRFLQKLRDRAKPLVILVNVKRNLRRAKQLEMFLTDPSKDFEAEGGRGVAGHVARIQRFAREHYGRDDFQIVPVQLLAAVMAGEQAHAQHSKGLRRASRVDAFLDALRIGIIHDGTIRRSQTILGCSSADLALVERWLSGRAEEHRTLANRLDSKRLEALRQIERAGEEAHAQLASSLAGVFHEVRSSISPFAEEHWEARQEALGGAWKSRLDSLRLERRIKECAANAQAQFKGHVEEALEEIGREMEAIARLTAARSFAGPSEQETGRLMHNLLKWGGNVIMLVGAIGAAIVGGPFTWVALVGTGLRLLAGLFKSKKEQRREAVKEISKQLREQVATQEREVSVQATAHLEQLVSSAAGSIDEYFGTVINGLGLVADRLEHALAKVREARGDLDRAFAERMLGWVNPDHRRTVHAVWRAPGNAVRVTYDGPPVKQDITARLSQLVQERVEMVSLHESGEGR